MESPTSILLSNSNIKEIGRKPTFAVYAPLASLQRWANNALHVWFAQKSQTRMICHITHPSSASHLTFLSSIFLTTNGFVGQSVFKIPILQPTTILARIVLSLASGRGMYTCWPFTLKVGVMLSSSTDSSKNSPISSSHGRSVTRLLRSSKAFFTRKVFGHYSRIMSSLWVVWTRKCWLIHFRFFRLVQKGQDSTKLLVILPKRGSFLFMAEEFSQVTGQGGCFSI